MRYKLFNKHEYQVELEKSEATLLDPFGPGGGDAHEDPRARLSEIIKKIHSLFTGKHTDAEIAGWFTAVIGNTVRCNQPLKLSTSAEPLPTMATAAPSSMPSRTPLEILELILPVGHDRGSRQNTGKFSHRARSTRGCPCRRGAECHDGMAAIEKTGNKRRPTGCGRLPPMTSRR